MSKWFTDSEATVSQAEVIRRAAEGRFVLLGETHDKAEIHRWQLHCAAALSAHRPIVMGFEMFPERLNPVLDEWVAGGLSEAAFLEKAEWGTVWGFPPELYLPLFHACREMGWPMRGLNVARSLVKSVGAEGWEGVAESAREGLTKPCPSPMPYRQFIFDITGGARSGRAATSPEDPAFDRFLRAQEVWDRAFATRLKLAADEHPEALVLGIIGMGHLQFGGGVSWQLQDLGAEPASVLLPVRADQPRPRAGAADAYFSLPSPVETAA